jgi:FkbH-like protein
MEAIKSAMQETVVNQNTLRYIKLPVSISDAMIGTAEQVNLRGALVWGEHCTECLWPSCFSNCMLYTPRSDLKCRRFVNGIEYVADRLKGRKLRHLFSVSFRTWAKIEAEGLVRISKPRFREMQQIADSAFGKTLDYVWIPHAAKIVLAGGWNKLKGAALTGSTLVNGSDVFAVECYSETSQNVNFVLRIIGSQGESFFEENFVIKPEYNFVTFDAERISKFVDLEKIVRIQLEPINQPLENRFTFSVLDFVRMNKNWFRQPRCRAEAVIDLPDRSVKSSVEDTKIKCVVWDLDNTIWSGILTEDGPEGIRLRPDAVETIVQLDGCGILQSVASKNNGEEAKAALKRFGLLDYFLYPQIHWNPKSESIAEIAKRLNIGLDTFAFLDDQAFEREEVLFSNSAIRTYDALDLKGLLDRPEFQVPVTAESKQRRLMYKVEEERDVAFSDTPGDFLTFLRGCQLQLIVRDLNNESIDRAFELTQRTNQLNYGGRRVQRVELEEIKLGRDRRRGLVLSCEDRFGDYGVIGFLVVDTSFWIVEDFFMSCRVQRKRVENALFALLQDLAKQQGADGIRVRYRPSARNAPALDTLNELGFRLAASNNNKDEYICPADISQADIVRVDNRTVAATVTSLAIS